MTCRSRYSKVFERYAPALAKKTTGVVSLLGGDRDTIKSIFKCYLFRRFARPKLEKLKCIAVGEIGVRKGQKYLTLAGSSKATQSFLSGKIEAVKTLFPFWEGFKKAKAKIVAVATAMNAGDISAAMESQPDASIHI